MEDFSIQDLIDSRKLVSELLTEVSEQEGTLAGGEKRGLGGTALQDLYNTRVFLGDPTNHLIKLTPDLFDAVNVELQEIWRQQMESQFDFYYLTLTVSIQTGRDVEFQRLRCHLQFIPEHGSKIIVQRLFPVSSWKEILT